MMDYDTKVLVKRHGIDGGIHLPKKPGDVGFDLVVSEDTIVPPLPVLGWIREAVKLLCQFAGIKLEFPGYDGKATIVPAGVSIKIPYGYFASIVGRSSSSNKLGILVHTATIDNGYVGGMFACVWNLTGNPVVIKRGERLAQVVFLPAYVPEMLEVEELPTTERGETGFGSTGR